MVGTKWNEYGDGDSWRLSMCVWSSLHVMEARRRGGGEEATAESSRHLYGGFLRLFLLESFIFT